MSSSALAVGGVGGGVRGRAPAPRQYSVAVGCGEVLANPTVRSASLPFDVFFSSSSGSSVGSSDASDSPEDPIASTPPQRPVPSVDLRAFPTEPAPLPGTPQSTTESFTQQARVASGGTGARRFLSEPVSGNDSTITASPPSSTRKSRRSSRVSSLARWYERLASGPVPAPSSPRSDSGHSAGGFSAPLERSRSNGANVAGASVPSAGAPLTHDQRSAAGMHAVSLPRDFASSPNIPGASDELVRLRAALHAERAARTAADSTALSLQNALRNSKKKVDAQKQRIDELSIQLNDTLSAMAPVQEILAIAERNFYRKEQTLKKIIAAQQQQSPQRDRRKTSRSREKREARSRYITESDL